MRCRLALLALALGGCTSSITYMTPPAPICMPEPAKAELRALCAGRWAQGEACESLGAWIQEYARWRRAVYGADLCRTAEAAAD